MQYVGPPVIFISIVAVKQHSIYLTQWQVYLHGMACKLHAHLQFLLTTSGTTIHIGHHHYTNRSPSTSTNSLSSSSHRHCPHWKRYRIADIDNVLVLLQQPSPPSHVLLPSRDVYKITRSLQLQHLPHGIIVTKLIVIVTYLQGPSQAVASCQVHYWGAPAP